MDKATSDLLSKIDNHRQVYETMHMNIPPLRLTVDEIIILKNHFSYFLIKDSNINHTEIMGIIIEEVIPKNKTPAKTLKAEILKDLYHLHKIMEELLVKISNI